MDNTQNLVEGMMSVIMVYHPREDLAEEPMYGQGGEPYLGGGGGPLHETVAILGVPVWPLVGSLVHSQHMTGWGCVFVCGQYQMKAQPVVMWLI